MSVLGSYAVAAAAVVALATGWLGVQRAWRRVFPEACHDPDSLAGRTDCHGCRDEETCDRRDPTHAAEEAS